MEGHEIEAAYSGLQTETVYLLGSSGELDNRGYSAVSRLASSSGDVNMDLGFDLEEEPPSSSSSSAAALAREDCDHRMKLQKKESLRFNVLGTREDYINASGGSNALVDKSNDPGFEGITMGLTDDLLHMVFSFLEHVDLCGASMVCKQWRAVSAHEDFWRSLNFMNRKISFAQFEDICRRYPNATEVNISGVFVINSLVMHPVLSLRCLDRLTLGKRKVQIIFFKILTGIHSLRSLTIDDAIFGNGSEDILISHDRMSYLHIVKCRLLQISVRCPQLETLSLKRSHMILAELSCPLLHDLDISRCLKLSEEAIISAAASCPLLESLDMSYCPYFSVTDGTLREIASNCSSLHFLNVSYCLNISFESVRFLMLTVLKLHGCDRISSASMASLAYSSMLEVLELEDCNLLTSVSLDLAHLKTIRLLHCLMIEDLNFCCIILTSITVSDCPSLLSISLKSNLLQKLNLQKQESLTTLALQCQCLQEVDLTDCESLTNSICDVFDDGGGCPMLRSLVLYNCEGLTTVVFHSTSLITLSLAGCSGITSLKLACPHLEKVSLDGCDELEIASFFPVGLQSLNLGICPKLSVLQIEAPSMMVLDLKGCGVLSKASISCPILNSIDASYCSQLMDISATSASCPLIETLILMSCPSIGPDVLSSLCQLSSLTSLDLSYNLLVNLHPLFDSCLQLKVLKLQACKCLPDSSLKPLYRGGAFPSLSELDLSYGNLSQSSIDDLLACCTQLTHLSLNGCVNMHVLNWGFNVPSFGSPLSTQQPNRLLQNLNCVGCPNIKEVRIPPAACCFNLLSLNLSVSVNLKEVDLACLSLSCLNLSNCYSLEILKLDCPKLTSLSLQSCNIDEETVESAISECSILEKLDVRFCGKLSSLNMVRIRAACPRLKCVFSSLSSFSSIC